MENKTINNIHNREENYVRRFKEIPKDGVPKA